MATATLRTKATLDNSQFRVGLAQMNQGVTRFASGQLRQLGSVIGGAFAVSAVINFTKATLQAADAIDNTSKQLGIGVEELQALQREAELTAGSADKLTAVLHKIAKAQAEAVAGDVMAVRAFKALGIAIDDIEKQSPDRMFETIAKKIVNVSPASTEAAAAQDIMGRSMTELNRVIDKVGNEGLENLKQQMLETKQIMSEDMVTAADKLEEAFNRVFKSIVNTAAESVLKIGEFFKRGGAFWGYLSVNSGDIQGALVAAENQIQEDFYSKDKTTRKTGGTRGGLAATRSAEKGITVKAPEADALAKIGGIIGGQFDPRRLEAERNIKIQEKIQAEMEKLNATMAGVETNTKPLTED